MILLHPCMTVAQARRLADAHHLRARITPRGHVEMVPDLRPTRAVGAPFTRRVP